MHVKLFKEYKIKWILAIPWMLPEYDFSHFIQVINTWQISDKIYSSLDGIFWG